VDVRPLGALLSPYNTTHSNNYSQLKAIFLGDSNSNYGYLCSLMNEVMIQIMNRFSEEFPEVSDTIFKSLL